MIISGWGFPALSPVMRALLWFAPFMIIPGYVAGWAADVFGFRRATLGRRIAVSIPLSLAVAIVPTHIVWRFGSVSAVWRMFEALWFAFAILVAVELWRVVRGVSGLLSGHRLLLTGAVAVAAWAAVCLGSTLHMRIGQRLYFPVSAYDYMARVPMAADIAHARELPAPNPYLNPGHPTALRYHYLWPMMCGLAAAGASVAVLDAVVAGTVWAGIALLCVVALYLRFFYGASGRDWKSFAIAFALLAVTGLDIIPVLLHDAVTFFRHHTILPTVEWWNEQITGWLDAMVWVPHHVVSLTCGLMGFLLLWHAAEAGERKTFGAVLLAGCALAASIGTSVYVALVCAVFLSAWTLYLFHARDYRRMAVFVAAGVVALIFAGPFVSELLASGGAPAGVGTKFPVAATLRNFGPLRWAGTSLGFEGHTAWKVANVPLRLAVLPLNYFMELGFFFPAGVIYWRRLRRSGSVDRRDIAALLMIATSVAISTFLRSSVIANNDLGWRGFMPAQFMLLLWAVAVLRDPKSASGRERRVLFALLAVGAVTTAYDLVLMRGYYPLLDATRGVLRDGLDPDARLGARTYALANGYAWLKSHTVPLAVIGHNPESMDYQYGLYSDRKTIISGECDAFSNRPDLCASTRAAVKPLYSAAPPPDAPVSACSAFGAAMLVVQDSDDAWKAKQSWVWKHQPVYANDFMRIFECPPH